LLEVDLMATAGEMALRSRRLTLRAMTVDDLAPLLAMLSDPAVTRYLCEDLQPSRAVVRRGMETNLELWRRRGYGLLIAEDEHGFVGRVGAFQPCDEPDPQLSYALCRRAWGRGYATEGAGAFRDWLFDVHRPDKLTSQIARDNIASASVARKLGATQASAIDIHGVAFDIWNYSPSRRPRLNI
jgi:RimJ/RimL family protein N-acetyltransferase